MAAVTTGRGGERPRKKFSPTRSRLPFLILIVLLVYFSFSLFTQISRLDTLQHSVAQMQTRVDDLQKKNDGLWTRLKTLESDSYIEQTAREQLGLVKPGETRVITVPKSAGASSQERPLDTSISD